MIYKNLQETNQAAYNRLNDAVLRAFVVKQLNPTDHTSIYHIFERLNTGGTQLSSQEIRNCVYHGTFNDMLGQLNKHKNWRKIFGKPTEDKRKRDIELILRFFALHYKATTYQKPMKDFLSNFMSEHRRDPEAKLQKFKTSFEKTVDSIYLQLGEKPFHIQRGLNAAAFDAVSTVFAGNLDHIPADIKTRYSRLKKTETFQNSIISSTTDNETVAKRLRTAKDILFG